MTEAEELVRARETVGLLCATGADAAAAADAAVFSSSSVGFGAGAYGKDIDTGIMGRNCKTCCHE